MSIFDLLFPEQAAASHLRKMAENQKRQEHLDRIRDAGQSNLETRIEELERDVGILTLTLAALLETADENGTFSRNELKQKIDDLDLLDGFRDGRINAAILRKWSQ